MKIELNPLVIEAIKVLKQQKKANEIVVRFARDHCGLEEGSRIFPNKLIQDRIISWLAESSPAE